MTHDNDMPTESFIIGVNETIIHKTYDNVPSSTASMDVLTAFRQQTSIITYSCK